MLKTHFKALIFAFLLMSAAFPAFAWDDSGHKLTAYIAWQRMTPEVREQVIKLLRAAPEDAQLSTFYMSYGIQSELTRKRDFFMLISSWADIIKDRSFETRYRKYNKGNWHYDDIFWSSTDGKITFLDPPEDGGKGMEKVLDFDKVMRSSSASDSDKAIAIAWFVHIIGDLHQPLHTSARVTTFEAKGDQGGNTFLLTPQDTPREKQMNLHRFWDSIINANFPVKNDTCDSAYLEPIGKTIMAKYPYAKMRARLAPGDYEKWKKDSFDLATSQVFSADLKRFQMPSAAYKKKALRISEEQIALAGYRLGDTFNDIFAVQMAVPAGPRAVASNDNIPCKVIRKVMYPVTQRSSDKQTLEIALLDLCPKEIAARPMIPFMIGNKPVMKEYDVVRIFKTEAEARNYAAENNITDIGL